MDTARRNLHEAILDSREDMQSLSLLVGKNRTYLQQYLKRQMPKYLPLDAATVICDKLGLDWRDYVKPEISGITAPRNLSVPSLCIEELDVRAAAGDGALNNEDEQAIAEWCMPRQIVERMSANTDTIRIIRVEGDSMQPLLHPGDRVAVDTMRIKPTPPGLFIIWDGIGLLIKRVEHIPGTKNVRISSANEAYSTYEQPIKDLHIQGRVVWVGREI